MVIPVKDEFLKDLEQITNDDMKSALIELYDHLKGYKKVRAAKTLAKRVLKEMFDNVYTTDNLIPYKFLETNIGKVVFSVMFEDGNDENTYTIADIIELSKTDKRPEGYTKQYLNKEIQLGRLKGNKVNGRWMFTEIQVDDFLRVKKLKPLNQR